MSMNFKMRLWDKSLKKMFQVEMTRYDDFLNVFEVKAANNKCSRWQSCLDSNIDIMQFCNTYDRDGNPVFIGDKIGNYGYVEFDYAKLMFCAGSSPLWEVLKKEDAIVSGNIYERC